MTKQGWAKLAAIFSGLIFGIYWIPLRAMEDSGLPGLWAAAVFNLVAVLVVLPFIVHRWRLLIPGRTKLHFGTFFAGLAFVSYAGAFLYTEVIRVIVLFYILPIWGFILARIMTGDRITGVRWVSMALGLAGLVIIFGWEQGFPMPSNLGDWMALGGGMLWALASMLMLIDQDDTVNYTLGFIFWSALIGFAAALAANYYGALPDANWSGFSTTIIYLIPFSILIIIPVSFATMFGPSQLNPGTVGLLFMAEISVGTATAALFAGEPFGTQEILGVTAITLAGIIEPFYDKFPNRLKQT